MDEMRAGIGLRAYGQTDPLVAYKREAHSMYDQLLEAIEHQIARTIFHVALTAIPAPMPVQNMQTNQTNDGSLLGDAPAMAGDTVPAAPLRLATARQPVRTGATSLLERASGNGGQRQPARTAQKVGRNDPCPCGSGKKYKRCHGANA
jgi:preprotein translocase subunit SecA